MPKKPRSAAPFVVVGVLIVSALVFGAIALSARSDDDSSSSSASTASSEDEGQPTTAVPTTTVPPRVIDQYALDEFCQGTIEKWSDVPPHKASEPSRMWVTYGQVGMATDAYDVNGGHIGGSTVVSPQPDGVYTKDESVLARTRSVACVDFVGAESTGQNCPYSDFGITADYNLTLNVSRYKVTVYELHSGGVLAVGEFTTRSTGCPDKAEVSLATTSWVPTESEVLTWIGQHFVNGQPG